MKRLVSLFLAVALSICSMMGLSGCSAKKVVVMTRGQWIEQLAAALELSGSELEGAAFSDVKEGSTYFNAVQNCAAWDILDTSKDFKAEDKATVDFAIATAVRAIGTEKIAKSNYQKTLQSDEDMISFFRGISDMDYISGGALYQEWADRILQDMNTVMASLELEQYQDIGLTGQCVEVDTSDVVFSADGKTGTLQNNSIQAEKDTILVVNPSEAYPEGKTAKITSIRGEKFQYVEPSMEEVVDHVILTGTYKPKVIGVIPMGENVKVEQINGETAVNQSCRPGSVYASDRMYVPKDRAGNLEASASIDDLVFSVKGSGEKGDASGSASATIGIKNIRVTADIDLKGLSVKKACAKIDSTLSADFNASGSYSPDAMPLGEIICNIYGIVNLKFQASLSIGASGELKINWSLPTTIGVEYQKGSGAKFIRETSGSNLKAEAKAEAYIAPNLKGTFQVFRFDIASCGVSSGVTVNIDAQADAKKAKYCLNLKAHVPFSCFAGGEGEDTLLGQMGIAKSWTIWDAESSKIKKEIHIENNKIVPACTMENETEKEGDRVEFNYDEIKLPEMPEIHFEEFDSKFFGITEGFITISENSRDQLPITPPNGYKAGDVVCSSGDESIVSVSNSGVLSGNGAGITQIRISTKDEKYVQYCTVRVIGDYSVEFTPLSAERNGKNAVLLAC